MDATTDLVDPMAGQETGFNGTAKILACYAKQVMSRDGTQ
jgi:hypothetical protein